MKRATTSCTALVDYPTFEAGLAEGAGRAETQIYSQQLPYATVHHDAAAAACGDVGCGSAKNGEDPFGATIPEGDAQKIAQYLHEHYTPETRK